MAVQSNDVSGLSLQAEYHAQELLIVNSKKEEQCTHLLFINANGSHVIMPS